MRLTDFPTHFLILNRLNLHGFIHKPLGIINTFNTHRSQPQKTSETTKQHQWASNQLNQKGIHRDYQELTSNHVFNSKTSELKQNFCAEELTQHERSHIPL